MALEYTLKRSWHLLLQLETQTESINVTFTYQVTKAGRELEN